MKKALLLFSLFLLALTSQAQKWHSEYTIGYYWVNPLGDLREKIDFADGVNMEFYMISPDKRFAAGLELCIANYDMVDLPVDVNSSDVLSSRYAHIYSQVFNTFLTGRWFLKTEGPFLPYVNLKAGMTAFGTTMRIQKDDGGGCSSYGDMEDLHCSGTFALSVGGGFKADMSYLFKKLPPQSILLDFGCNFIGGGTVSYLCPTAPKKPGDTNTGTPYDEYIKTDEGTVHVNNVGNVYSSMGRMLDFRIGIAVRPSGWKSGN